MISKNPKNTHIKAMTRTKHARTEVALLYKINRIFAYFRDYTGNNSILIEQYTFKNLLHQRYYNISYCLLVLAKICFKRFCKCNISATDILSQLCIFHILKYIILNDMGHFVFLYQPQLRWHFWYNVSIFVFPKVVIFLF